MSESAALRLHLACVMALCTVAAMADDRPYEFGVFPYLPVTKIHELHVPMARDFEAKLGRPVRLSSKGAYAAFSQALRQQTYDVAFIQPFDYVDAHDKHGYLPLARRAEDLQALIVVRDDSPLRTIRDLKGKTVATPPVDAAVSHLTSMALRDASIDPKVGVTRHYARNHFTCLQALALGVADACSTAEQALRTLQKDRRMAGSLRALHSTPPISHCLFVVHRRVPREHREILLSTILGWPKSEKGRQILEGGDFIPFVPARDADYEAVRTLVRNQK
jgi:phosphonate transport system substrate-binding protein